MSDDRSDEDLQDEAQNSEIDRDDHEPMSMEFTAEELEAMRQGAQFLTRAEATPFPTYITERRFSQADEIFQFFLSALNDTKWVFRGHSDSNWGLQPTAERFAKTLRLTSIEQYVLLAFKRRAHQYLPDLPADSDTLEWLALAQHYGAPTKLLDFTSSPYVAAFFAVTEQRENESSAVGRWIRSYSSPKPAKD
jgi:hypothetical protein